MNVLIFDADSAFRKHLAQQLTRRGVHVSDTDDVEDAENMACREHMDAVLLGVSGQDRTHLPLLATIRSACPGAKVVFINRSGNVPLSIEAMKLGAYAEMAAPVDMEELERMLRNIRDMKRGSGGVSDA